MINDTHNEPAIGQLRPPRLLRLTEVKQRVGLGRTTIYGRVKAGIFPAPVKLGTLDAWVESEITSWIDARITERGGWASEGGPGYSRETVSGRGRGL